MQLKKVLLPLVITAVLSGCAGRPANPVMVDQVGDNRKSCQSIEAEMRSIEGEIRRLVPETDKTGKNVGLGIAGAIFIVPLFFMDLTESEKIEVNAYRQRYNRLNIISIDKNCDFAKVTQQEDKK
jgi:hypothetical protein